MATHRRPARLETHDGPPERPAEASRSRRRFLASSAAGAAGSLVLGTGAAAEGPVRPVPEPPAENGSVVQRTPSRYFANRGDGSEEMKWGPVRDYADTVPNDRFYIHNRARPPDIDRRTWRLEVTGDAITRPRSFGYEELLALPQVPRRRTLDCGANCRVFFPSRPPGGDAGRWLPIGFTQWHFGAVSAAEWTGVR